MNISSSSRTRAFLAYLFSLPGALIVLLTSRHDPYATLHARQSLALAVAALSAPVAWALAAWVLAWVPVVGTVLALALSALVIAAECCFGWSWVCGMVYALRGRAKLIPLVGRWAIPRPPRPAAPVALAAETLAETPAVDAQPSTINSAK